MRATRLKRLGRPIRDDDIYQVMPQQCDHTLRDWDAQGQRDASGGDLLCVAGRFRQHPW